MQPDNRFLGLDGVFWANVRSTSQELGYTDRKTKMIRVPTITEILNSYLKLGLTSHHVVGIETGELTTFGQLLADYFEYRADVLNNEVQHLLMNAPEAKALFKTVSAQLPSERAVVMNKQKGDKSGPAFLTNLVNLLVEAHMEGTECDFDPRQLTTITRDGVPLRTLARRVDGAYPAVVNPIAIWEIKEYYYTTTFGSRVADGVYESLLDGMELDELRKETGINVRHYLFIDSHFTWWECGRSYLCRMIDIMHMGYVDEVIFGREVETRTPEIVKSWHIADQPDSES